MYYSTTFITYVADIFFSRTTYLNRDQSAKNGLIHVHQNPFYSLSGVNCGNNLHFAFNKKQNPALSAREPLLDVRI